MLENFLSRLPPGEAGGGHPGGGPLPRFVFATGAVCHAPAGLGRPDDLLMAGGTPAPAAARVARQRRRRSRTRAGAARRGRSGGPAAARPGGRLARRPGREPGAWREGRGRLGFPKRTKATGLPGCTAGKSPRQQFATGLPGASRPADPQRREGTRRRRGARRRRRAGDDSGRHAHPPGGVPTATGGRPGPGGPHPRLPAPGWGGAAGGGLNSAAKCVIIK